ncbi:MAG: hypothetical protein CVU46_17705 [Chloroflexi bacterium HGW-Chloroflexi-8]|nr:MAG: hypothetical protein CVU46_17705 [Chloroflexi bacterium HGW-Chloroflexi-8]
MSKTLGQVLKETRESRGLSLADVSFQTKIREHYLDALEKDQISNLPSPVQGKGFLRNYASFLKLDEGQMLDAWYHPDHFVFEKESLSPNVSLQPDWIDQEQPKNVENKPEQDEPQVVIIHEFTDGIQTEEKHDVLPEPELKASQKIFISIGTQLKKQREILNLSLEDIERFTNLRLHYLQALEAGNFDQLPSVVQGKGMLSNYSNFLNMNSDEILLRYAEGLQTRRNEQYDPKKLDPNNPTQIKQPSITSPSWRRFITADLLIVGTLIVALFVFVLWGAANVSRNQSKGSPTALSLSEVLLTEPGPLISTAELTITSIPTQIVASNTDLTINPEGESPTVAIKKGLFPINLSIVANQRAYLRITSDNKVVFSGRVIPGNAYEFSGSDAIELLTGNASALDIYFNQQKIGSIGGTGEVKSLIFTANQGYATPTAEFTSTPTITTNPTSTPRPTITSTQLPVTPSPTVTPYIP